jgi:formylglycine-generating enzyme required for sulfatase activity
MTFSYIPPGSFLMGSPPDEEGREIEPVLRRETDETRHRVTLSRGFWLGVHPVTESQWQRTMGRRPRSFTGNRNTPAGGVCWYECHAFCARLAENLGEGFRLPSEAEWEYACRAGTTTPFHFGQTISLDLANFASYSSAEGLSRRKTTPVAGFPPNLWGLFDLHGNISEWCQDWYGPYRIEERVDPHGQENGTQRVRRGGSFCTYSRSCRSASRDMSKTSVLSSCIGFRILLEPGH